MKQGYDSWGHLGPVVNPKYKFVGLCFNNFSRPLEKHPLFDDQLAFAREQDLLVIAYVMWRGPNIISPETLAQWLLANLPEKVLVAADYEDRWSVRGTQAVLSIRKFGHLMMNAGKYDMSYTAPWWWDDFITPYDSWFTRGVSDTPVWDPYEYPLWLCDPAPFGRNPGDWDKWVVRQNAINIKDPEFNAAVDYDEMTDEYYEEALRKVGGSIPNPIPIPVERTFYVTKDVDLIHIVRQ